MPQPRLEKKPDPAYFICECSEGDSFKIDTDGSPNLKFEIVSDTEVKVVKSA